MSDAPGVETGAVSEDNALSGLERWSQEFHTVLGER